MTARPRPLSQASGYAAEGQDILAMSDAGARGLGSGRTVASESRGTEYVRDSGAEWMSGGAKRQCDRALGRHQRCSLHVAPGDSLVATPQFPAITSER
jgi:hypothetical protein